MIRGGWVDGEMDSGVGVFGVIWGLLLLDTGELVDAEAIDWYIKVEVVCMEQGVGTSKACDR